MIYQVADYFNHEGVYVSNKEPLAVVLVADESRELEDYLKKRQSCFISRDYENKVSYLFCKKEKVTSSVDNLYGSE